MSDDVVEIENSAGKPLLGWRDITFRWLGLGLFGVILATLIGFGARLNGFAELFVHFKVVYFAAAVVFGLGYGVIGRWRWVAVCLLLLSIHTPGLASWYLPRNDVDVSKVEPNVRVLIANVMTRSTGYEEVIDYIRERDPDVVLLQEISVDWMEGMRELVKERYPYSRFEPRFGYFGMATFSRFPATRIEMVDPLKMGIPVLDAVLEINGRQVAFLNYHPMPPFDGDHMEMRNRQLANMGEHTRAQEDLVVLAGDMNVTPWSPVYRDAIEDAGLVNARQGFGVMPTWPALGLAIPVVPIDHCLVSPEIVVTHLELGPRWGSDHRALWVEMYVPSAQE